jgi:hypothetical protein
MDIDNEASEVEHDDRITLYNYYNHVTRAYRGGDRYTAVRMPGGDEKGGNDRLSGSDNTSIARGSLRIRSSSSSTSTRLRFLWQYEGEGENGGDSLRKIDDARHRSGSC